MAMENPSRPTQSTLELRLATTMTGGVSLAIWMAGVAREINLLAQASQWRRAGVRSTSNKLSPESEGCLRLYAGLIDFLDTIVDVDILSGTSAGGINAALLGWSRLSGVDLGGLRELWLELGALIDLLRDPADDHIPSLLYGDKKMFKSLADEIPKLKPGPFPPAVFPPPARFPTTLYVTTTLLAGETGRFTDAFGSLVQDVDQRGVFTFTDKQLAMASTIPALALAARSSASYPFAFEPSFLPFTEGTPETDGVPPRPAMHHYTNTTRSHWVVDGGLLDNRPIGLLLRSIFDRPARRQVRRVLLFVVPSAGPTPDLTKPTPGADCNEPLGLIEALQKDLGVLVGQSIATDLRAIRAHQDRMAARTNTKLRLAELAVALPADKRLLTGSLLADYATSEATKHAQELTSALLRQLSTWPVQSQSNPSAESIPERWKSHLEIGGDAEKVCRTAIIETLLKQWPTPEDWLPNRAVDFARYGRPAYEYAKGCAITVMGAAYQLAKSADEIARLAEITRRIHAAGSRPPATDLGQLVHTVYTDKAVRDGSFAAAATVLATKYLEQYQVSRASWRKLGGALARGHQVLTAFSSRDPVAGQVEQDSLDQREHVAASQLTTYLRYLGPNKSRTRQARKLFDLATTQRAMLPAEAGVDQGVELVQVSADTRSLLAPGCDCAKDKLTGMQFHNFGAFYKRSWRANDWMWGRLDGSGWLVHVLLDPRRVRWIVALHADERREGAEGRETGAQWLLRRLKELAELDFPTGAQSCAELLAELAFVDDPKKEMPPSLPKTSMWLAQAWQQRVLQEELDVLAETVSRPDADWSPRKTRKWAARVLATDDATAKYGLLKDNPIAKEKLADDRGSPLMSHTAAKAVADLTGAAQSVPLPGFIEQSVDILRELTLALYRVVSRTGGTIRSAVASAVVIALGVAAVLRPEVVLKALGAPEVGWPAAWLGYGLLVVLAVVLGLRLITVTDLKRRPRRRLQGVNTVVQHHKTDENQNDGD